MNDKSFSILFVCTGNTCRSPMAEGLLKAKIPPELRQGMEISSAGAMAAEGLPATPFSVRVLARRGVAIDAHRSRLLTREMIQSAHLVLAMEEPHRRAVLALDPEAGDRTFVLSEFGAGGNRQDRRIHDPMGGSEEIYEESCKRIDDHLNRVLPEILGRIESP